MLLHQDVFWITAQAQGEAQLETPPSPVKRQFQLQLRVMGQLFSTGCCGTRNSTLTEGMLLTEPYLQDHLFKDVTDEEKQAMLKQLSDINAKLPGGGLSGYLSRARGLLKDAQEGKNPFEGLVPKVPEGERLCGETGPGSKVYAEYEQLGMEQLELTAFCLVAGGLGERLGYPGIKIGITSEVTTGVTFIETYIKFILSFQEYVRKNTGKEHLTLPLAIMTSGDTHLKTVELLQRENYFGMDAKHVILMQQEKAPALMDADGRIAVKNGKVETKPHGHGDVHSLLYDRGLPHKWAQQGRKWLIFFQDTNPLPFRSLCAVLGVSAKNEFDMNSVAVPRFPSEAVGGICRLESPSGENPLTINVEYSQLDPLLKATPTGGDVADASGFSPYPGNINILVLKVPTMDTVLEKTHGIVPEFVNPKWADATKTNFKSPTRLECMMQDYPRLLDQEHKVGFTQLDRLMCFTCVKNNIEDAAKKNTT